MSTGHDNHRYNPMDVVESRVAASTKEKYRTPGYTSEYSQNIAPNGEVAASKDDRHFSLSYPDIGVQVGVVFDGVGSLRNAESNRALNALSDAVRAQIDGFFTEKNRIGSFNKGDLYALQSAITTALNMGSQALGNIKSGDRSTFALAVTYEQPTPESDKGPVEQRVFIANIGDTRVYAIDRSTGRRTALTVDDSVLFENFSKPEMNSFGVNDKNREDAVRYIQRALDDLPSALTYSQAAEALTTPQSFLMSQLERIGIENSEESRKKFGFQILWYLRNTSVVRASLSGTESVPTPHFWHGALSSLGTPADTDIAILTDGIYGQCYDAGAVAQGYREGKTLAQALGDAAVDYVANGDPQKNILYPPHPDDATAVVLETAKLNVDFLRVYSHRLYNAEKERSDIQVTEKLLREFLSNLRGTGIFKVAEMVLEGKLPIAALPELRPDKIQDKSVLERWLYIREQMERVRSAVIQKGVENASSIAGLVTFLSDKTIQSSNGQPYPIGVIGATIVGFSRGDFSEQNRIFTITNQHGIRDRVITLLQADEESKKLLIAQESAKRHEGSPNVLRRLLYRPLGRRNKEEDMKSSRNLTYVINSAADASRAYWHFVSNAGEIVQTLDIEKFANAVYPLVLQDRDATPQQAINIYNELPDEHLLKEPMFALLNRVLDERRDLRAQSAFDTARDQREFNRACDDACAFRALTEKQRDAIKTAAKDAFNGVSRKAVISENGSATNALQRILISECTTIEQIIDVVDRVGSIVSPKKAYTKDEIRRIINVYLENHNPDTLPRPIRNQVLLILGRQR